MNFSDLGLCQPVLRALEAAGYSTPTPIQAQAIPHILSGRDVFGCAQTGTGKTAAFALPIIHRIATAAAASSNRSGRPRTRALILTPTHELASQIASNFESYARHLSLRCGVVFGGVGIQRQIQMLARGVDVVVATPGRLLDLLQQRAISLADVRMLVLDEADRMLDMGFINDVIRIADAIPKPRQTLMFSATLPPRIRELAQKLLSNPMHIAIDAVSSTAETLEQSVYFVDKANKRALLHWVLDDLGIDRTLTFTRTKHGADRVVEYLQKRGVTSAAIHGNKSQNARERALELFKEGKIRVLVASDIAARGIDIDRLSHVINFEVPNTPESYVHRIGRSGRAGATGTALSFCDATERPYLRSIERLIQMQIRVVDDHPHPPSQREAAVQPVADNQRRNAKRSNPRGAEASQQSARRNGDGRRSSGHAQQQQQPRRRDELVARDAVASIARSFPDPNRSADRPVKPGFSSGSGRRRTRAFAQR